MSWSNLIQYVDKHNLPWSKRATEHLLPNSNKKNLSFYNSNKMLNKNKNLHNYK